MAAHHFIFTAIAILATLATYELNIRFKQGPVRASSIMALLTGGFFYFFPSVLDDVYVQNIPLYVVGGSFIGMVSSTIEISYFSLIFSPVVFATLLHFTSKSFDGYGGVLGAMACISLMCTMAFPIITKHQKVTYGYRLIRVLILKRKRRTKR